MHETIVVGGGQAGLQCALRLQTEGRDYRIVTDRVGGRVRYSSEEKVNFGAYFQMANYTNAKTILDRRTRINPLSACFHGEDGSAFPTLSLHTLLRAPQFVRFAAVMRRFITHYGAYKAACEVVPQREALAADPWLGQLFHEPASEFVARHRLRTVAAEYVSKFSYACTGVDMDQITALDFLNVSMGMIVPIHRFAFDEAAMHQRLGEHLVDGRVTIVRTDRDVHTITLASGETLESHNLVLATPASVTAGLLGIPQIRGTCRLYVSHVRATLKPKFARQEMNLFPFSSPVIFTALQDDGSYLIYTRDPDADLHQVCERYELIGSVAWEKAMYVTGRAYVEQQYGDSLYVAGDHNGLGMEPAAISGIYAANQILRKAPRPTSVPVSTVGTRSTTSIRPVPTASAPQE